MNLKTLKALIIGIVILIIIILASIIFIKNLNLPNNEIATETEEAEEVKFRKYNEVKDNYVSDIQMCNIYLNEYKNEIEKNVDKAYNLLDEEYSKKRFGNIENFKKYVQSIQKDLYKIKIEKYNVVNREKYKEYTCIDQYGNYYIFQETAVLQYKVILDNHTISTDQYIEKYNKASNQQKAAFCIDRFIKIINDENYTLAYSMLADGFKNNYFKTQESFEKYVKQNLLGKKELTLNEVQNEADIYIYKVNLAKSKEGADSIEKNFNVRLGKGTEFELSFNID